MADVGNTSTMELRRSVNTSEFTAPWVVLTRAEYDAASAIPQIYREWNGSAFVEMSQASKDAVDAAIATVQADATADQTDAVGTFERAFAEVVLDEINLLRAEHSLAPRTLAQFKTAVRGKL